MNEQVGLAIAIHITLQMPIGKTQFRRSPAEGFGVDVLPAWIGEGIRAVQYGGDPQPIAPMALEIGDRVPAAAGGVMIADPSSPDDFCQLLWQTSTVLG